jgi:hypothetical protein
LKYTLTSSQRLIKTYQNPKIEIYPSLFYKAGKDIKTPKLKYTLPSSKRLVKKYQNPKIEIYPYLFSKAGEDISWRYCIKSKYIFVFKKNWVKMLQKNKSFSGIVPDGWFGLV